MTPPPASSTSHEPTRTEPARAVRIAAVADLHVSCDSVGDVRPGLEDVAARADVLLLPGDLTQHGAPEEAEVLADELGGLGLPVVAVLGNHDYHQGQEDRIRATLEQVGVVVLEGGSAVVHAAGSTVGIAGVKGFGGGFAGACCSEFGEAEMKAFVRHSKQHAARLHDQLAGLTTDFRVAMTHYSPVAETLAGERTEIYPFLGSYLLAEAIDGVGCELALHGHAHHGREHGRTPGGVPVRNVARPVLAASYRVYCVGEECEEPVAAEAR